MRMIGLSPHRTLVTDPSVPQPERPLRVVERLSHLPKYFSTTITYQGSHPLQFILVGYRRGALCIRRMPVTPPKHF